MSRELFTQMVSVATGLMLLTAVLQMWRRSLNASIRLLTIQGAALAALVASVGVATGDLEVIFVAALILAVKAMGLPWALARTARGTGEFREDAQSVHPTTGVMAAAGLTLVAYLVSQPIASGSLGPAARSVPVGMALVLIGFLLLLTRHTALSQVIGFLVLDNGITAIAFLTSGGLPLTVELGVLLDVLLVIVILRVLAMRMQTTHGGTTVDELSELRD